MHPPRRRAARAQCPLCHPAPPGRGGGARPPPASPRGLAWRRGDRAPHRPAPRALAPPPRACSVAALRGKHAGRGVAGHGVALASAGDAPHRGGDPRAGPPRLSELRARQLPGGSRSSRRHARGAARPRAGKEDASGVRRSVLRSLPPAWVVFRRRLRGGARRFREIDATTRGYFGWPAAARAETAIKVMRLRGKLIAVEVIRALGPLPRRWRKRG